jgi:sterol 3beta-glucosyltransferase
LALELRELGATPVVVASEEFESLIHSYGLEFRPTRGSVSELMKQGELQEAALADNPLKAMALLADPRFMERLVDVQEDFAAACADAEAILYHPGAAIGHLIAKERGIPSVLCSPFPVMETAEYPSLLFYQFKFPRFLNRVTHRLFKRMFWSATKKPVQLLFRNRLHRDIKLKNPLESNDLKLVSCSPAVFRMPPTAFADGYWFLDEPEDYSPPTALEEFLAKGERPVYVGFGSMGNGLQAERITKEIVDALRKTGVRAILATGSGGLHHLPELPDEILVLEAAPHSWLFPRCAMAIHHGGAGTTAEGFRAGIPMVIVPHGNDQFAWGKRVLELGVGPAPIPIKKLTSDGLVKAIETAGSTAVVEAAKAFSSVIRQEHGARTSAERVMAHLKKSMA